MSIGEMMIVLNSRLALALMLSMAGCSSYENAWARELPASSSLKSCDPITNGLPFQDAEPRVLSQSLELFHAATDELEVEAVRVLGGACAMTLIEAVQGLVRMGDGSVYWIDPELGTLKPLPSSKAAFAKADVTEVNIPAVNGARLVDVDDYMMLRTKTGQAQGYIGLWTDGRSWTVASFAVPEGSERSLEPRPLLRSKLPLRGITFFPAPDTLSGQLWLVQEATASEVRVILIHWRHGNTPEGTTARP